MFDACAFSKLFCRYLLFEGGNYFCKCFDHLWPMLGRFLMSTESAGDGSLLTESFCLGYKAIVQCSTGLVQKFSVFMLLVSWTSRRGCDVAIRWVAGLTQA